MKRLGWLATGIIIAVYLVAIIGLGGEMTTASENSSLNTSFLIKVVKFSLLQAFLSTLISIMLAIPVARALHRQQFPGKSLLLSLAGLSLVIPVIVAILGIVAVHGNAGWLSHLAAKFNLETHYLYGLAGILIAHVFFNLPLATRILLLSLNTIPNSSWRLARHLGMRSWDLFRFLEWPLFKVQLPQLAGLIFLLCFTSFAIVLVFGGGLKYSTLEVSIYQALQFDFNLAKAVKLALVQVSICAFVFVFITRKASQFSFQQLSIKSVVRDDGDSPLQRIFDVAILILFLLWVLLPILAILAGGLNFSAWSVLGTQGFWLALKGSLWVSLISGCLAAVIVLSLCYLYKSFRTSGLASNLLDLLVQLILIFPPFVLATGLFIVLRGNLTFSGPIIVILINILAILPFMMRVLLPSVLYTHRYDRLSTSLGLININRLSKVDWPLIKKSFALALGVGLALSVGDFSVIALFGSQDFQTLPLYLYRLMGAYRTEQAGIIAIIICMMALLMFFLSQRLVGSTHAKA